MWHICWTDRDKPERHIIMDNVTLLQAKAIIEEFTETMRPDDSGTLAKLMRYIDAMIEENKEDEHEHS